jgi:hypothetical protein
MGSRSTNLLRRFGWGSCLVFFLLIGSPLYGQSNPFEVLLGSWSGSGTVKFTDGGREQIKCNAVWELPDSSTATARVTCVGRPHKGTIQSTVRYHDGLIGGSWSETTREVEGTLSGRIDGNRILLTVSRLFPATVTIITSADQHSGLLQAQGTKVESISVIFTRDNVSEKK